MLLQNIASPTGPAFILTVHTLHCQPGAEDLQFSCRLGVYTKFSGRLSEEPFPWLILKFPSILIFKTGQPGCQLNLSEGHIRLDLTSGRTLRRPGDIAGVIPLQLSQGVQPWALTKFPDFSLTFPWPICDFPWPWDILSAFHYCLNTNFASNLTNHSPKVAITK